MFTRIDSFKNDIHMIMRMSEEMMNDFAQVDQEINYNREKYLHAIALFNTKYPNLHLSIKKSMRIRIFFPSHLDSLTLVQFAFKASPVKSIGPDFSNQLPASRFTPDLLKVWAKELLIDYYGDDSVIIRKYDSFWEYIYNPEDLHKPAIPSFQFLASVALHSKVDESIDLSTAYKSFTWSSRGGSRIGAGPLR